MLCQLMSLFNGCVFEFWRIQIENHASISRIYITLFKLFLVYKIKPKSHYVTKELVIFNTVKMIIRPSVTIMLPEKVVTVYKIEVLVNCSREPTGLSEFKASKTISLSWRGNNWF